MLNTIRWLRIGIKRDIYCKVSCYNYMLLLNIWNSSERTIRMTSPSRSAYNCAVVMFVRFLPYLSSCKLSSPYVRFL